MNEIYERLKPWLVPGLLCAAGIVLITLLAFAGTRAGNIDDAFILLTYVKHLANDGVIAWNLRDGHVDGYTSFLDLLLKTALLRITNADLIKISFWLTLIFDVAVGLVGFVAVTWYARERGVQRSLGLGTLAGLLLASSPSLASGAAFMLETPLLVAIALVMLATFLLAKEFTSRVFWALVIEATLLAFARPEGILVAGVMLVVAMLDRERPTTSDERLSAGLFVLAVLAYSLWHKRYFGYWAPNTYYAKSSASRWNEIKDGWDYVIAYAGTFLGFCGLLTVVLAPFAAMAVEWKSPTARYRFLVIEGMAVLALIAVILAGGDSYGGGRFLALPIALGSFGVVVAIASTTGRLHRSLFVAAAALTVFQVLGVLKDSTAARKAMAQWPVRADDFLCEQAFGNALSRTLPGASVAESDYELLKYFADSLYVIDLQGINDRDIAHKEVTGPVRWGKFSEDDVVRLRPDIWLWGFKITRDRPMSAVTTRDVVGTVHNHKYFTGLDRFPSRETELKIVDEYVPVSLALCNKQYNMFVRKDRVNAFSSVPGFTVGRSQ
jgi:hypothetical protein